MAVRLHLTHIPELDQLTALEYGRVDEGLPREWVRYVGAEVEYFRDERTGVDVGFKVREFATIDVDASEHRAIWGPPRFDVPMLGITGASAGEITVGARAFFAGRASIGHTYFALAAAEPDGEEALELWRCCLEAGEGVAHYGLGCTLYRLGRYHEAYSHLSYFASLAPELTWTWCSYGLAADALDLHKEAEDAFRRAVALEDEGGPETGAREFLAEVVAEVRRRRGRSVLGRRARRRRSVP
jgi:tetratricopeptide (TPR) repeat protein